MSQQLSIGDCVHVVIKMAQLQSVTLVQRAWKTEYSQQPPTDKTINAISHKFLSTGSVLDAERSGRPRTSDENADAIVEHFSENPCSSIRSAATQLNVSFSSVQRTLKTVKLRPSHIQLVQQLHELDYRLLAV